ncbi:protein EFFECTOR OF TRANSCRIPTION 2-like [Malus sylvestris]|uniref:protein EFFECTOR OF TRANSCRIPTION 2-like n=1 Tax=Malus sylvestris TaxID=3752 RepID=UPI0021AD23D9|nr:protein EFFECTOR OF TRANSCRIPTION 2-like [Malus sylvestris]
MEAGNSTVAASRLKREDCERTTNDSRFSTWKILVGPSDWKDHSLGKEGAERYRVHNLPEKESPDVYELGVSGCSSQGREIGKHDPGCIVPVYLGQADNVRTRLQQYGRSGAHLGKEFEDLLSRGNSIAYRWASLENQSDALKTENRRLGTYNYAWNRNNNGARRPDDVHQKLKEITSSQKKVGIRIESSKPISTGDKFGAYDDRDIDNSPFQVFKLSRAQPRLVSYRSITEENTGIICGVDVGDGSVCRIAPVPGRQRCAEHKGMRIKGSTGVGISNSNVDSQCGFISNYDPVESCGFILADGSSCRRHPIQGRKRCYQHKGRRI